ncbi:hypothetical protein ODZ84_13860 [Chryseobacterium fluminis]|uniref:ABC-three component system middle component 8 n=1 Tax=Chryseobacterium TaxID=59732 RepID=UPI0006FEBEE2|nr:MULTISPECIES: ABC-three component system middle component 8 [unclassified Chryseobacterium]KQM56124.1 hypothetical protein ASE55_19445 [Chryseobacterium sp. Leaf201]UZT96311.1 hypothetical protein ODZ84_13860 [Chryseobacterium sp. MMS21-Ot14]
MLKPDKHTDIKYSVVYLSAIMLKEIQLSGIIKYDELKNILMQKIGNKANENFEQALSFLYLLDRIHYLKELDSIKQN